MLTRYGTTITRTDPHRHKFADTLTEYMYDGLVDMWADRSSGEGECPTGWFAQMGRRILMGDDRGFVWHETYPDKEGATFVFDALDFYYGIWADEDEELSEAARMMQLVMADKYLAYVVDCAQNMCEPYDVVRWNVQGRPNGVISTMGGQS